MSELSDTTRLRLMTGTRPLADAGWRRQVLLDAEAKNEDPALYGLEAALNRDRARGVATAEPPDGLLAATWPLVPSEALAEVCRGQITAAREAVQAYRAFSLERRIALVRAVGARLLGRLELWRELTVQEGYCFNTFLTSLDAIVRGFDEDYLRYIASELAPTPKGPYARVERVPFGVVGVIVPANASFPMLTQVIEGALLSGNAIIAKPSHKLAVVALRLIEEVAAALEEHGAPPALVSSVACRSTQELIDRWLSGAGDETVDQLVYIGSSRHRDSLLERCRRAGGPPPILEFEGVDAAYVHGDLSDARLAEVAALIAYAKNVASGQYCVSLKRLYVDARVHDRLVELLQGEFARYRPGALRSDDPLVMGPCGQAAKFAGVVSAFLDEGGELRCGGARLDARGRECERGPFVEPTLITGARPESELLRREHSMPLLPVVKVHGGAREAAGYIERAGFGLRCSLFANDPEVARVFEAEVTVGTLIVNGNHLDFSVQIAGGRGGTTLDQNARVWALDLTVRRVRIDRAPRESPREILRRAAGVRQQLSALGG